MSSDSELSRRKLIAAAGIGMVGVSGKFLEMQQQSKSPTAVGHVVLLGDSIFDNQVYVGDKPCVIDQVQEKLGPKWRTTLLAVDGDLTRDVSMQVRKLPESATHLIVSVGGNDALQNQGILNEQTKSSAQVFQKLAEIQNQFGTRYEQMLDAVMKSNKPTAVCTVYDPNFPDARLNQMATAALAVFNDRITRAAFQRGMPVIDLRLLFSAKQDYANPIEPGPAGGAKIAEQIDRIVTQHDFTKRQSVVYPKAS